MQTTQKAKSDPVLISGASGLIGSALARALGADGFRVTRLVRRAPRNPDTEASWDPEKGLLDEAALEGAAAVVHLAGESIASGRWTPARKARIRESRVRGTTLLAEAIARSTRPPRAFLCASAIGVYGDRGDEPLTEASPPGEGFLAEVTRAWEAATEPAARAGIRVVNLRFGIVLGPEGGVLQRLLVPFRLGLGGKVGSGKQWMSWVSIDDAVGAIRHALGRSELSGPVNIVSPAPVSNATFTKTLGRVLGRPTILGVPALPLRLALGEMADELLLSGARVLPAKLEETRYAFQDPELEEALRRLLEK